MGSFRVHPDILHSRRLRGFCGIDGVSDGTSCGNMPLITGAVKEINGLREVRSVLNTNARWETGDAPYICTFGNNRHSLIHDRSGLHLLTFTLVLVIFHTITGPNMHKKTGPFLTPFSKSH
jgi:hypothetical protein